VEFWQTTRLLFPTDDGDPSALARRAIVDATAANDNQLNDKVVQDTRLETSSLISKFLKLVGLIKATYKDVVAVTGRIEASFNAVFDSVNAAIDILIKEPLALARQVQQLLLLPGQSAAAITDRLDAYGNLLDDITGTGAGSKTLGNRGFNNFLADELIGSGTVLGASSAALNAEFGNRSDAIAAADRLLGMFAQLSEWRDDNYRSLDEIDTGESYQAVLRAVLTSAGFLVEISFTLAQERSLVLDRPRSPVDLVAELYGSYGFNDSLLDFFVNTNDLVGTDILEVPRGREVFYYV